MFWGLTFKGGYCYEFNNSTTLTDTAYRSWTSYFNWSFLIALCMCFSYCTLTLLFNVQLFLVTKSTPALIDLKLGISAQLMIWPSQIGFIHSFIHRHWGRWSQSQLDTL